ncbi:MAG TPA: DUF6526 family protein [Thermoanaerobaculia bacterium]|jgi:hypothetical protein|nr:DUF6526 family protein [Thermoanaerobaculia bacterium]
MERARPQTYASHRRFDPLYHFFAAPVLALVYPLWAIVHLWRHPTPQSVVWLLFAFAVAVLAWRARSFPLAVQDRLIALEERLRIERLPSPEARAAAGALTDDQLIGLRFASDEELAELAAAAVAEKLDRKAIKKRVRTWRPDHRRA